MAIATTRTLLSLDEFAEIVGIHPLHFNQIDVLNLADAGVGAPPQCDGAILQYSWQNADMTGREDIAQTIADVEARIGDYLNFAPMPAWYANQSVAYPVPASPDLFALGTFDVRGMGRAVKLPSGYVVSGGQEAKTLISANAPLVYSDADGDGYFETATINVTVNPLVVQASEVALYYPGNGGTDEFEIRPVTVTINATTGATSIQCRRDQLVSPELLFGLRTSAVDGLVDANFLTTVDVYRHWTDPSVQVEFRWESTPWPGFVNSMVSTSAIETFVTQNGAMLVRDSKLGWADVQIGAYDPTTLTWSGLCPLVGRAPDSLRVWFKAGWPTDARGGMAGIWKRAIAYLTLASLDRPLCGCDNLRTFTEHWAYDFARNTSENTHQISRRHLDNPLGTTRAARHAWEQIMRYRLLE